MAAEKKYTEEEIRHKRNNRPGKWEQWFWREINELLFSQYFCWFQVKEHGNIGRKSDDEALITTDIVKDETVISKGTVPGSKSMPISVILSHRFDQVKLSHAGPHFLGNFILYEFRIARAGEKIKVEKWKLIGWTHREKKNWRWRWRKVQWIELIRMYSIRQFIHFTSNKSLLLPTDIAWMTFYLSLSYVGQHLIYKT